jgi:hypothetical protein
MAALRASQWLGRRAELGGGEFRHKFRHFCFRNLVDLGILHINVGEQIPLLDSTIVGTQLEVVGNLVVVRREQSFWLAGSLGHRDFHIVVQSSLYHYRIIIVWNR